MEGHSSLTIEMRSAHKFLDGKPERKRPLVRLRRRYKDNIEMDLTKIWGRVMD
jgi:hypothetical protein